MKNWKSILIGTIIGTLISGGVWVWSAPIQSQVGINIISSTGVWNGVRGGSTNSATMPLITNNSALTERAILYGTDFVGSTHPQINSSSADFATITPTTDAGVQLTTIGFMYGNSASGTGGSATWMRLIASGNTTDNQVPPVVGSLRTSTFLYGFDGTNFDRIRTGEAGDNLTNGTLASQLYGYDGTNFDRVRIDASGSLNVNTVSGTITANQGTANTAANRWPVIITDGTDSINVSGTSLDVNCTGGCAGGGSTTPSDAFANPTTANLDFSLLGGWNGATWDRLTSTTANGLDVDVTRLNDGGNSITVDNTTLSVIGGGAEATVLRVTIANDSTGLLSVDDNGGSLTVDGTVAVTQSTSPWVVGGSITPADDFSNPSTAVNNNSLASEFDGTTWDITRHSFTQTTAGIAANGAGASITETTTSMSKHTMIVDRTAGATNTVDIRVECSIDGTDFVQIASITDLTNEPALVSQDGTPCYYIRYNVITIGAGNTVQIHLLDMR